jgi:hypothetical protein
MMQLQYHTLTQREIINPVFHRFNTRWYDHFEEEHSKEEDIQKDIERYKRICTTCPIGEYRFFRKAILKLGGVPPKRTFFTKGGIKQII